MNYQRGAFRRRLLGIALFTLLAACVFLYFLSLSGVSVLPHSTYVVHVRARDIVALSNHADVLEAGVKVGSVDGISSAGSNAELTLVLDRRYGPVYRDGEIAIRGKTLVGENYVDLAPGHPQNGGVPSGGFLSNVGPEPTQLDQIFSTFDAPHRRDLQQILDVLGSGIGKHGAALNSFLDASGQLVDKAAPVAAILATDRQQLASLIDDFGAVTQALGQRAEDIRRLVINSRLAAQAVAVRNTELRQFLAVLPGFLSQARTTIHHLGVFSQTALPVVANLSLATQELVPAMQTLAPAAQTGIEILNHLTPFAQRATATANELIRAAPVTERLLGPLQAVLRQANPLLAYLAPYGLELATLFPSMDAATHYHDASAGYARVSSVFAASVVSGVSPTEQALFQTLINDGILAPVAKDQYNAYPRPMTATHPVPFTGTYPHIQPDPPYKTPRGG